MKSKSLALKVERALKQISQDFQGGDDKDSEDQEIALITKTVKRFWKKSQPGRTKGPPNVAEIRCCNC